MTESREFTRNPTSGRPRRRLADLFCGAGGTSSGARKAIESLGEEMDLTAVNHWTTAIETHQANHPEARHYVADLEHTDPEALVPEGSLDLLMASPECKDFSRARGGKPVHDQGRMQPWSVMSWLTKLDVAAVLVENVPEFVNWGPRLPDGRRDPKRKGQYFQAWFMAFQSLGYRAEYRFLNAADYGDATSRTRFFLIARKDGRPIQWPEPSHARDQQGMLSGRLPWRAAREIIDWSHPGRSLLDDPKYLKKPLAEKTRMRIAKGLEKFGGPLAPLFIDLLDIPDYCVPGLDDRRKHAPFILNRHGDNGYDRAHSIDQPFTTITGRGGGYLVQAGGQPFMGANRNANAPKDLDAPVPCITTTTGGGNYLVEHGIRPFMLPQHSCAAPRDTADPVSTICTAGAISLVQPTILQYYGQSSCQRVDEPLSTITGFNKHALVEHVVTPLNDARADDEPSIIGPSIIEVAHGNGYQGHRGNDRRVHDIEQPMVAITTSPGLGLATPVLVSNESALERRSNGHEETEHRVSQQEAERVVQQAREAGIDPRRVVFIQGQPYLLDIRFRMFMNEELSRATGFDDEETSYTFHGKKADVTKQIGNAVPVNTAAALVGSILSDLGPPDKGEPNIC